MFSFTVFISSILCAIFSLCPISLVENLFFLAVAKIKIKFLYSQMSHGLKCEMIVKKLLGLNYPPPFL